VADTIAFDAGTFDRLITFMTKCKQELDDAFLDVRIDPPLTAELGTYIKPGSPDWLRVIPGLLTEAGNFGGNAHAKISALSKEWGKYIQALIDAKAVFEKSSDLATMSASDFVARFPGLAPSGTLPPGGAIV
jgi:hypothetical protein